MAKHVTCQNENSANILSVVRLLCCFCCLFPDSVHKTTQIIYNSIIAKREQHLIVRCLDCGTLKRFNTRKNYQLWCEQQQDDAKEQPEGQCSRQEQKTQQNEKTPVQNLEAR